MLRKIHRPCQGKLYKFRCIFNFSHDHVVHFVDATHQRTRNFLTHRMNLFLSKSGKWKLRYSSKTECGFVTATWHMYVWQDHKLDRTCVSSQAISWSRSRLKRCSTSWETSITRFGTLTTQPLQLRVTAAPHVWDEARVARDGYIDGCSDNMFAKGRASKFILHDPNFHHPFQNMGKWPKIVNNSGHFPMFWNGWWKFGSSPVSEHGKVTENRQQFRVWTWISSSILLVWFWFLHHI